MQPSLRFAGQLETVKIVDQSIQYGICQSRVRDMLVPGFNRDLGDHQRRRTSITIIQNIKQILGLNQG